MDWPAEESPEKSIQGLGSLVPRVPGSCRRDFSTLLKKARQVGSLLGALATRAKVTAAEEISAHQEREPVVSRQRANTLQRSAPDEPFVSGQEVNLDEKALWWRKAIEGRAATPT